MNSISSFTGLASGIQWADLIDQIMNLETARKLNPLTDRVTLQQARRDKWSAYESLLSKFNTAASTIRDRTAFGVLKTSATKSSQDKTLISASASTDAVAGSYEVEVIKLAKADKLSGSSVTSTSSQLGYTGEFYVNGRKVDLVSTDTLSIVRDKINAVNSGSSASGVTATILTTSATEHRLVLTSDNTGNRGIELVDGASNTLESLGIVSSTKSQNTKFGDTTKAQTQRFSSTTTALASMLGVTAPPAVTTIMIDGQKITVDLQNDTMLSLLNKVQNAGISASNVEETVAGKKHYRMEITGAVTADATASDPTASQRIVELLGFEKKAYASNITTGQDSTFRIDGFTMTRRTNTVTDAITGVTLNLLASNGSQRTASVTGAGLSIGTDPQTIDAGTYSVSMTHTTNRTTSASTGSLSVVSAPGTVSAGTYDVNITTAASVASVTGSGFSGTYNKLVGSDTMTVTDGTGNAGSVVLTNGKTLATIISELNASFTSSGATLQASNSGGQLRIVSTTAVGSSSTFTVSSTDANVATNLGINNGTYNGTNVAGTIGGIAATGSGDVLTGSSGAVNGLQVRYTGTSTGSPVGNVTVTDTATVSGVTIGGVAAVWDSATSTIKGAAGTDFEGLVLNYSGSPTTGEIGTLTVTGDIAVTLNVTRDLDSAVATMQSFASAYNEIVDFYNSQRGDLKAPLYANGTLRSMQRSLTESLLKTVEGLPSGTTYNRASLAGVALQDDGKLEVDAEAFKAAMQTNLNDIKSLFGTTGSTTNGAVKYVTGTSKTKAGTYAINVTTAAAKATHLGTVWGGNYSASNGVSDTLTITDAYSGKSVDFVATEGMTLSEAVTELTELFANNNVAMTAVAEGGALRLSSTKYGSAMTFTLAGTDAATRLGLTESTYAGTDIAGTIGGNAATGVGAMLTGGATFDSEGLAIEYTGTTTGSMGSVSYILGIAGYVDRVVDPIVRSGDGTIPIQLEAIDSSILTLNSRVTDVEARLETRRATLEMQFLRMEEALAMLNSQGQWLASQIKSLQSNSDS